MRCEEAVPRVDRHRPEVVGDARVEVELGTRVGVGEHERHGYHCRHNHSKKEHTTHTASLPPTGFCRRTQRWVLNQNRTRSASDAITKKENR
jgi:hypothetical protein